MSSDGWKGAEHRWRPAVTTLGDHTFGEQPHELVFGESKQFSEDVVVVLAESGRAHGWGIDTREADWLGVHGYRTAGLGGVLEVG